MKKILICDDAMFMRNKMAALDEKMGFESVQASNGIEAVEKFRQFKPDLVTMDINMPEMDGREALKEIKKIDPNAKVIMISAMGSSLEVVQAVQEGALGFIVKPFKDEEYTRRITELLKG